MKPLQPQHWRVHTAKMSHSTAASHSLEAICSLERWLTAFRATPYFWLSFVCVAMVYGCTMGLYTSSKARGPVPTLFSEIGSLTETGTY